MEPGLAFIRYTCRRRSIALAGVVGVSGQERAGQAGRGPASHGERYEKNEQATHFCLPTPQMLNNSFRRAVTRVTLRMLAARSGSPPLVGEVREGGRAIPVSVASAPARPPATPRKRGERMRRRQLR